MQCRSTHKINKRQMYLNRSVPFYISIYLQHFSNGYLSHPRRNLFLFTPSFSSKPLLSIVVFIVFIQSARGLTCLLFLKTRNWSSFLVIVFIPFSACTILCFSKVIRHHLLRKMSPIAFILLLRYLLCIYVVPVLSSCFLYPFVKLQLTDRHILGFFFKCLNEDPHHTIYLR